MADGIDGITSIPNGIRTVLLYMARCSIHQKSRLGNYTPKRRPRRPDEVLRRSIAVSAGIVSASVQYVRNIRSKQRPAALTSTLPSTQLSPQRPLKRRCGGMWSFGLILKSWQVKRSSFLSCGYASTRTATRHRLFAAANLQSLLDELHKMSSFREGDPRTLACSRACCGCVQFS